jgi:hypothetical protein
VLQFMDFRLHCWRRIAFYHNPRCLNGICISKKVTSLFLGYQIWCVACFCRDLYPVTMTALQEMDWEGASALFLYEVWLWSSRNYFIPRLLMYSQLTEKNPPLNSYALSPTMLSLLETFLELLLWNSFQWLRHIFLCLHYPEIFVL